MKDIHSHLIYGVDDGSKSLEESIELLKKMEEAGTTDLMLTPHYVENSKFSCNNKCKKEIFNKFQISFRMSKYRYTSFTNYSTNNCISTWINMI